MAEAMVSSILKDEILNTFSKKIFLFLNIKNSTYDHIDTNSINETIKTNLIKSDKAMIIEIQEKDILNKNLDYKKIRKVGKQLSVYGIFYGEISAIYQKNSSVKDMFFKFTLKLIDVESSEIVWSAEKKVRKVHEKSYIGW